MCVWRTDVAGYHGIVIDQLQQPQPVAGEDGLFLGALDGREEVDGVGLFEFLPGLCQ